MKKRVIVVYQAIEKLTTIHLVHLEELTWKSDIFDSEWSRDVTLPTFRVNANSFEVIGAGTARWRMAVKAAADVRRWCVSHDFDGWPTLRFCHNFSGGKLGGCNCRNAQGFEERSTFTLLLLTLPSFPCGYQ